MVNACSIIYYKEVSVSASSHMEYEAKDNSELKMSKTPYLDHW